MVTASELNSFAVRYNLVSKSTNDMGYAWENTSGVEASVFHDASRPNASISIGLNRLKNFSDIINLERYLLGINFVCLTIRSSADLHLAADYKLLANEIEGIGCSLTGPMGGRITLLCNTLVYDRHLESKINGMQSFASANELETYLLKLGFISPSDRVDFESELSIPHPCWPRLGHALQSIERRIDRLLLHNPGC
jgi:hypothetical protein